MSHVAPHKWAMRLPDRERAVMNAHADGCERCARARDRITVTTDSFAAIKTQQPPEVAWDSVRARVHWSVSTERRAKLRAPRSVLGWWVAGAATLAATGAVIAAVVARGSDEPAPIAMPAAPAPAPKAITPAPVLPPAPLGGLVSRVSGNITIDGVRTDDLFHTTLAAGSLLATADGKVDVQFGEASAFSLGPKSSLELRHFDRDLIELVVDGTVDVEVAARGAGQRFLVHAGDQTVEVRGTQFRVSHDPSVTTVACRHGLVAVSDRTGLVEVGAARGVAIRAGEVVRDHAVSPLSKDELATLVAATPIALPSWSEALATTSAPLEIATVGHRETRIDGIELGTAPMFVRVTLGRHTVETADASGRFRRAGWVDVAANKAARVEVAAESRPTTDTSVRKSQLRTGIDKTALGTCMRRIKSQGLDTNAFVEIEIEITGAGAVHALNVLDTDLPSPTATCVHDVLVNVHFGAGPAARWREKIDL